jgi:hypothetical protein
MVKINWIIGLERCLCVLEILTLQDRLGIFMIIFMILKLVLCYLMLSWCYLMIIPMRGAEYFIIRTVYASLFICMNAMIMGCYLFLLMRQYVYRYSWKSYVGFMS